MKIKLGKIAIILSILLGIILLINIFLVGNLSKALDERIITVKETAKPAKLGLIKIINSKCSDCFDINEVIEALKKSNVEIKEEVTLEFDSEKAKNLINKYDIEKIPAIVLVGEINKTNFKEFEKKENILLFAQTLPPYTDAATKEIKGRVSLTHIKDSSCSKCSDVTTLISQLKEIGVVITEEKTIELNDADDLIKKYDIKRVPVLILSKGLEEYSEITDAWGNIGTVEDDGSHVLRLVSPPYMDISTNKVNGLVSLTYLTDNSCKECYDVVLHKQIVLEFGIAIENENTVDIASNEGKSLIEKYNISLVPTIILSKDASYYAGLQPIWKQVGTIENDGNYVFRDVKVMKGSYKDLATNKVIEVK